MGWSGNSNKDEALHFAGLMLALSPLSLSRAGERVALQRQALKLLALLVTRRGGLVTHDDIRAALWPNRHVDFARSTHVHIHQIRSVLGEAGKHVRSVPGEGYCYDGEVLTAPAHGRRAWPQTLFAAAAAAALAALIVLPAQLNVISATAVAEEHFRRGAYDQSQQLATVALRRDSNNARAHVILGRIALTRDWQWRQAARHFDDALAIDNDMAAAHHGRAASALLLGDPTRASGHLAKALHLHSASTLLSANYGWVELVRGEPKHAAALCELAIARRLAPTQAHVCLARALIVMGQEREAALHAAAAMRLSGAAPAEASAALDADDPVGAYARWRLARQADSGEIISPGRLALLHAWAGARGDALTLLERAHDERDPVLPLLLLDPSFNALANDQRFIALTQQVGVVRL